MTQAWNVTDPPWPLTAAAVIAKLNEEMYVALEKVETLEDRLSNVTARLNQYENCDWPKGSSETPLDVIARMGEEIAKLENQLETLEYEQAEWEGLVANKDAEIKRLRSRVFDTDGFAFDTKVENLHSSNIKLQEYNKRQSRRLAAIRRSLEGEDDE